MEVASGHDVLTRWPRIHRWLHIDAGRVDDDLYGWSWRAGELSPEERAAGYEEWADFYEWCLDQRAADRRNRLLVEEWTDSMAYCCRRSAAWARGEDPGEWVPRSERRPDLDADRQPAKAG